MSTVHCWAVAVPRAPVVSRLGRVVWMACLIGAVLLGGAARAASGADARAEGPGCQDCHRDRARGFAPGHGFGGHDCTVCHGGDPAAPDAAGAHSGLRAHPAGLDQAPQACGGCHPSRLKAVSAGLMHTGRGMVETTRRVFGESPVQGGRSSLSDLGQGPADSLLRKLCAGCHLGQPRAAHGDAPIHERGGGCGACRLERGGHGGHPRLTTRVSDARCLGCHSRSGRVSLSYAGLAEIDGPQAGGGRSVAAGRLADGRLVERRPADVHHTAGLSCIDCHTARGVMGPTDGVVHQEQAVDIACTDCHANSTPRLALDEWPADMQALRRLIPFATRPGQRFLVTARQGTPLWHIELRDDGPYLYPKLGGPPLPIPQVRPHSHGGGEAHRRLSCAACHSQWAPQCYGCHLSYEPEGSQWDHADRAPTRGRWHSRRWDVRNGLPVLGVDGEGRITPFVPGMIMTGSHPEWTTVRSTRLFSPLFPHTTGTARSCQSCHRSPTALGLGRGRLEHGVGGWRFAADGPPLPDGLSPDAWTDLEGDKVGGSTHPGARPLNRDELQCILDAPLSAASVWPAGPR